MKLNRKDLRRLIESFVEDRSASQINENKAKKFFARLRNNRMQRAAQRADRRSIKTLQKMADKENQRVVSNMQNTINKAFGQNVDNVTFEFPEQQIAGDPDSDLPTLNFPEEEIAGNPQDAIMNDLKATYDFKLGNTMQDAQKIVGKPKVSGEKPITFLVSKAGGVSMRVPGEGGFDRLEGDYEELSGHIIDLYKELGGKMLKEALNRRDLRWLIESVINEEDKGPSAVQYGLMNGVGAATYLGYVLKTTGLPAQVIRQTFTAIVRSGSSVLPYAQAAEALGLGSVPLGSVVGSVLGVTGAAIAGYSIGSYIQDVMSGNTGNEEEKMFYSFKKSAKDNIGELGVKIFGFDIAPTWDTLSDHDYLEKTIEKGYKGLRPRDIDPGRLGELVSALIINRNFTTDGKLPKELDELFAYRYLDAEAFKPFIEKKEKEIITQLAKKVNKKDVEKLASGKKEKKEATNESLSRGSLYRRRYYGRY